MDIFKFHNPNASTKMEQGEIINGFSSKMWIERYSKEGEFTLVAPLSSGIREKLPRGCFISHVDTDEIMIVENHEINDNNDGNPQLTITGRGYETFLENRIVGSNKTFPFSGTLSDYVLSSNYSWYQAESLIRDHIEEYYLLDDSNALPYVTVGVGTSDFPTDTAVNEERVLRKGTVFDRLLELLAIDNLGIKVVRPSIRRLPGGNDPDVRIYIHFGVDRTADVVFSYDTGEVVSADYLWSNKKLKNAAYVSGKWVETVFVPIEAGYDRKMTMIDASDLDEQYSEAPTGWVLVNIDLAMKRRAKQVLASLNEVAITKAEISKSSMRYTYREDFEVGDIVTIHGDYNEVSAMRVSEYVEIEDETGESGYPTLSLY